MVAAIMLVSEELQCRGENGPQAASDQWCNGVYVLDFSQHLFSYPVSAQPVAATPYTTITPCQVFEFRACISHHELLMAVRSRLALRAFFLV